ncbi:MAG: protein kinase [Polyangiaceae bacterium]
MSAVSSSRTPGGATRAPERFGRYLVFAPFAQGGMASVHMGRLLGSSGFSRLVALKRLHPIFASSPEHYQMLLDEARITSRIRHPNVVPILDVVHEGENLFLVMEYVSGVSLNDLLQAAIDYGEPIPPSVASALLVDVLRGLHAAHEARAEDGTPLGVVHRDVSPHNVIVGVDGTARILDFGVAKALKKDHLTVSGEVKGKVAYMAPEQLRGLPVTRQTDLFAAGIVLWESLTGRRLFDGEPGVAMLQILEDEAPPPSERRADLPKAVDTVLARALSKDARSRYGTAEEMALDLIDACPPATREDVARYVERVAQDELDRRQNMAREAERAATPLEAARNASPEPTRSVASETAPRAEEPTVRLRGVRPWHVLVGTLALVLVAGGGWLALRPHDGTSAIAPAQASPIDSAGPPRAEPVPSPTTGVSATSTESVAPSTTAPVPSTSATSANTARAKPRGTSPSKPGTRAPRALDPEESAAAGDRR